MVYSESTKKDLLHHQVALSFDMSWWFKLKQSELQTLKAVSDWLGERSTNLTPCLFEQGAVTQYVKSWDHLGSLWVVVAEWLKIRAGSPKVMGSKPRRGLSSEQEVCWIQLTSLSLEQDIWGLNNTLACRKVTASTPSDAVQWCEWCN